jgi:hypothetical protein
MLLYVVSWNKYQVTTDSVCIDFFGCNFKYWRCRFLVAVAELQKRPSPSSGLSIRMEQLGSHWTDFHEI